MFQQIKAAKERLYGQAHITPIITSATLDQQFADASFFFKCENLQRVGAFKFRGAFNAIARLTEWEKERGVLAFSSGNHAQAIACVGQLLNVATTIVMPENAPTTKLQATRAYGAEVITYNPQTETRESVADAILRRRGLTLIPPFDHESVIAGQGTVACELLEAVPNLNAIIVPCGGGGLLSGIAVAAKNINPDCQIIGVEPELADDATRSFYAGRLQATTNPATIADGVRTSSLGDLTFPLILRYVDQMITVSETAIKEAVRFLFYRMKMVVEPSGAIPLAAILSGRFTPQGNIGLIVSGGNIDGPTMCQILSEPDETSIDQSKASVEPSKNKTNVNESLDEPWQAMQN
ncbi:pyridoxal-phosphate dependent enzyme [Aliikangiella maris]|uniref:Pyridoxal-phosphate dependent enzyme n=2 Tax=Aliikangiella maris TaxID=3162458 RepID=A0ABV2BSB9_9GAMM